MSNHGSRKLFSFPFEGFAYRGVPHRSCPSIHHRYGLIKQNGLETVCKLDNCQVVSDQEVVVSDGGCIARQYHYPYTLGLKSCTEILLTGGTLLKTEMGKKVVLVNTSRFLVQDPVHVSHPRFWQPNLEW